MTGVDDLRVAPFHRLATEGAVHTDEPHLWHMETLARLAATGDPRLVATLHRDVDTSAAGSAADGIRWWEELTGRGADSRSRP